MSSIDVFDARGTQKEASLPSPQLVTCLALTCHQTAKANPTKACPNPQQFSGVNLHASITLPNVVGMNRGARRRIPAARVWYKMRESAKCRLGGRDSGRGKRKKAARQVERDMAA